METVLALMPKKIKEILRTLPAVLADHMEEIRIRIGRPLEIAIAGEPRFLPCIVDSEDAAQLLSHLSQFSLYTLEEELKRGYITIAGGHRVGLAGKVILENGAVKAIRDISSFNIRIARQKIGAADSIIPHIYTADYHHTLIVGAPQTGKTTMLRDIARFISSGSKDGKITARKVGVVDERSEIAGCVYGIPQLTFGPRIDVLDSCPKAEGMMMLIRSMSPEVLVADEIGRIEDAAAVMEAVNAGIKLIISVHGHSVDDVKNRPNLAALFQQRVFERFIVMKLDNSYGRSFQILNQNGDRVMEEAGVT
ncbi:stage III sporulation protein AA [Peribacillus sp. SCS-155]|uniref:stage III sporulation protein AA n=1 Tax=Peribacillus sedimenti TaxID=3115297 RepID=UPI003906329F